MKKVNISQVDTIFVDGSYSISFLLYYKDRISADQIRKAMKDLSADFWPLFGRYDKGQIIFDEYIEEEHFHEEQASWKFDNEADEGDVQKQFSRMRISGMEPLFSLKIIQYPNGTALIPELKHMAGDGYTYFYFLSILAAFAKETRMTAAKKMMYSLYKPHHQRTVLKDFHFSGLEFDPFIEDQSGVLKIQKISRGEVRDRIKSMALSRNQRVSTNDVLSALFIKDLISSRDGLFDQEFNLAIPIDVRKHIKEYGPKFVGNALMLHRIPLTKSEVERLDTDEMAIKIRHSMPSVTRDSYIEYLKGLEGLVERGEVEKLVAFDPAREILVTNLSKLPVDRLDFGNGPPDLIFPLTMEKNAAGIMADEKDFILRSVA